MMKRLIIFCGLLVILSSCGKPYNSSSGDEARFGTTVQGSANFLAARAVILNKCATCHNHAVWASYTEAQFISEGKLVARNLADSPIYFRIRGNDTGSVGDMPPTESLSTEEITTFKTWIMGI